jgi:NDP-sugar pyrophosphorylase family protein
MRHPLIVDGRNLLDPDAVRALGFAYEGTGRRISATDVLPEAAEHEASGAAGTIVVAQVRSPFGVVAVEEDGTITGFQEAPLLEHWVNSGVYVLGEEALALLPEKGDHEQSTFPQLAAERRLHAHRHEGVWLTVNTPKDLRRAAEFLEGHPDWRPQRELA